MRYTDLIFDLYGTLVDIHTEEDDLAWKKTALYLGYYGVRYTGAALKTDYESEWRSGNPQPVRATRCSRTFPLTRCWQS